jgi:hypothetical protein
VTAKQIRSDSTMQITPMTVLFLKKAHSLSPPLIDKK